MPSFNLSTIDLSILFVYFFFIIWLGLRFANTHESTEEYFLAGRRMIWPFIGISLFASNISSTTLLGLSGAAYSYGISIYNYEWMASVVLVFFAIFFLPLYINSRVYTMPEFLEKRFDKRSRYFLSIITLIGNVVIDTAGSLFAGGIVLKLIFPEIPMEYTIAGLALIAGLYTIAGGLAAVIFTDAVQTILILLGSILICIAGLNKVGGWHAVTQVTPPEMLSLIRPMDDPSIPWTGLIFGVSILGFYFWCNNQFIVQRVLSAKNLSHARWGVLFAALLKLPVLFIMVFPGTIARVLYPDLTDSNMVFPVLAFDLLPAGIIGLVIAGLLAAIMSSIDSTLNSASTLVTMDFVAKLRPDFSSEKLMWVGRFTTFIFMTLAAIWAPQIANFESLFGYLQRILAYLSSPVVAVFLLGVFWKRANSQGAFLGLLSGLVVSIFLFYFNEINLTLWKKPIHFLHIAPILCGFSAVVIILVSLSTSPHTLRKIQSYLWTKKLWTLDSIDLLNASWYQNYRILSVILIFLTAAVVFIFR